ncbi:MAG: hypothetical protein ACT4PU_07705 [Planctomycetota bacterium]
MRPSLDLADRRHVRALYLDLFGRTPNEDELELAAAGSAAPLIGHLLRSREFWEHWLEDELYYFLLIDNARPEEGPGEESLAARLTAGRLGLPQAVIEIVSSSAFHRANPGNDTFVSVVLEQLLGLNVQRSNAILEAAKRMYDGQPSAIFGEKGQSQADVVRIVSRQPEFPRLLVQRQYERLLGSAPAAADLTRWAADLASGPESFTRLVQEWLLSEGYARRLSTLRQKTDVQYLRGLYLDVTGALPEAAELQRLRGALSVLGDAGPLRSVIARSLLDRQGDRMPERSAIKDREAFIRESFLRYLGRTPSAAEAEAFELIFAQEDVEPATVVLALLTHPEYQGY